MFLRSSSSRPEGHRLHTATKTLKQHVSDGVCQHSPMHDLFTHSLTNSILEQTRAQHAEKLVEQATSKLDNWATTRKTPTTCFYIVRTFSLEGHTCNQKFSNTLRNLLYRGKTGSRLLHKASTFKMHDAVASNSPPRSFRNARDPCTCAAQAPDTGRQARPRSAPRCARKCALGKHLVTTTFFVMCVQGTPNCFTMLSERSSGASTIPFTLRGCSWPLHGTQHGGGGMATLLLSLLTSHTLPPFQPSTIPNPRRRSSREHVQRCGHLQWQHVHDRPEKASRLGGQAGVPCPLLGTRGPRQRFPHDSRNKPLPATLHYLKKLCLNVFLRRIDNLPNDALSSELWDRHPHFNMLLNKMRHIDDRSTLHSEENSGAS